MSSELLADRLLENVPVHDGFKVLEPCVLYARLGQGGMGAVYRGRHLNLDLDVAVKCLKPRMAEEDSSFVVRFQREARLAAAINHENLIQVFDVAHRHGVHYLIMEFVRGETARQRVQRKGALAESEATRIVLGAARGLAAAHARGVVHRDIKPDNIMVSAEGRVKVADLGIAKVAGNAETPSLTGTGLVMGTPQYMSPEQARDTSKVGPASDVWSLGWSCGSSSPAARRSPPARWRTSWRACAWTRCPTSARFAPISPPR